eukprot:jgi/Mesen1/5059/ME000252S04172
MDSEGDASGTGQEIAREGSSLSLLAKDAEKLFKSQRFSECLDILRTLQKKKENDPKVLHNIAVAEFQQTGCTDAANLLKGLSEVKARSEELARAAENELEGVGESVTSASANSAALPAYVEDYDTSIATVNTGILLYHLQQYATAYATLEPLYRNIEPLDEAAALRVCLVMLDISLASGQPDKAAAVLAYVEKTFGYLLSPTEGVPPAGNAGAPSQLEASQSQSQSQSQDQQEPPSGSQPSPAGTAGSAAAGVSSDAGATSATVASASGSGGGGSGSGDGGGGGSSSSGGGRGGGGSLQGLEEQLSSASLEEGLEDETLALSLQMAGSSRHSAGGAGFGSASGSGPPRAPVEQLLATSVPELKLLLHLLKARLLLLTRNFKATKREVKAALGLARDHVQALLLKAHLEYMRGNHRKSAIILNNLACVHHRLGKHHLAAFYLSKALAKSAPPEAAAAAAAAASSSGGQGVPASSQGARTARMVFAFSSDTHLAVLYNAGVEQLLLGNPDLAAKCLQEATAGYYQRPLLWLRLAEACIASCQKRGSFAGGAGGSPRASSPSPRPGQRDACIRLAIAGEGRYRRVVMFPSGPLQESAAGRVPTVGGSDDSSGGGGSSSGTGAGAGARAARVAEVGPELSDEPRLTLGGETAGDATAASEKPAAVPQMLTYIPGGPRQEPSMVYARQCLSNALYLVGKIEASSTAAAAAVAGPSPSPSGADEKEGEPAGSSQGQQHGGKPAGMPGSSSKSGSERISVNTPPSSSAKPGGEASAGAAPDQDGAEAKFAAGGGGGGSSALSAGLALHEKLKRRGLDEVRQVALADLAYVELCLDNPQAGLQAAQKLLQLPGCARRHRFLGHMYAAEALCLLGRPAAAREHLSAGMLDTNAAGARGDASVLSLEEDEAQGLKQGQAQGQEQTGAKRDHHGSSEANGGGGSGEARAGAASMSSSGGDSAGRQHSSDLTGSAARATLYINLAAVCAMQGELAQAQQCALQALSAAPTSPIAMLSVVFVELSRGHTKDALAMLKHCRHVQVVSPHRTHGMTSS